MMRSTKRT